MTSPYPETTSRCLRDRRQELYENLYGRTLTPGGHALGQQLHRLQKRHVTHLSVDLDIALHGVHMRHQHEHRHERQGGRDHLCAER